MAIPSGNNNNDNDPQAALFAALGNDVDDDPQAALFAALGRAGPGDAVVVVVICPKKFIC